MSMFFVLCGMQYYVVYAPHIDAAGITCSENNEIVSETLARMLNINIIRF